MERHILEQYTDVQREPIRLARQLLNLVKLDIVEITVRDRKTKRKYTWKG